MDNTFSYDKPVTGKHFIGRKTDVAVLSNLIRCRENIVIYEPPKSGKMSLIQQSLFGLKKELPFVCCELNLFNIRSTADLIRRYADAVMRSLFNTPSEYSGAVTRLLPGTHFIFDPEQYQMRGRICSLNWEWDEKDLEAAISLPWRAAEDKSTRIIVLLREFQNVMFTEDGEQIIHLLEKFLREGSSSEPAVNFIFMGSAVNAMDKIFRQRKFFFRQVERVRLSTIDPKEIIEHIVKGFQTSGKVINSELLNGVCRLFRNNIWHINHFASVCDSLTRGYILEPVMTEALNTMISTFTPTYCEMMDNLTGYQVSLLKAIAEGYTKISTSEVIEKYGLNSSANVRRLKDALCKKEIISFDDNDRPYILDPLFEYWVCRCYFEIPVR